MKLTKISKNILRAVSFFQDLHKEQKRKDNVRPYFVHLDDVASRVSKVTDEEDIIIAALGHDSVEDVPGFTIETVRQEFGPRVANIVLELTDTYTKQAFPSLNRKARKQKERERYAFMSPEAKLIKLADIASNLEDDGEVLEGDGKPEVGFNRMFIKEKALCLPYLVMQSGESASPFYRANAALYVAAVDILKKQAKKFDVKLG